MKKVLFWVGGIVAALIVLGAIFGEDDQKPNHRAATADKATAEEVADESTPEPTPTPTPTPERLDVNFVGPMQTASDQVKLKGVVAVKGAKVKVNGKPAAVKGRHWSF